MAEESMAVQMQIVSDPARMLEVVHQQYFEGQI